MNVPTASLAVSVPNASIKEEARRREGSSWPCPARLRHPSTGASPCGGSAPDQSHNIARRDFREVLKRAGLPRIRFHDLRHTTATLHLAGGVHPKTVAGLLGHSSVQVTLDTYSHAILALQEEAALALGARLLGTVEGR